MIKLSEQEIENAPEFMSIEGYEGLYEVGKDGSVWSLDYRHTGQRKQMVPVPYNKWGYLAVRLSKDGKQKTRPVHQLVLNAYIPKPSPELVVMHKNSKPADNRLDNLAWGTIKENQNDPHFRALLSKPVLCVETGELYSSMTEASHKTAIDVSTISLCCNGKRQTAGGFHWQKVNKQ